MDIVAHIKENKNWWISILVFSFIISFIFPVSYTDKSVTYNMITNSIGTIVGGLIMFLLFCGIASLIKKPLNNNQVKIVLIVCFAFWWLLQILNHFDINI